MQRMPTRGDVLLRKIGIGAALQQQLHNLDVPSRGSVAQRSSRAGVIRDVVRGTIAERRVFIEQLSYPFEIADIRRSADVAVSAARTEMIEHLARRGCDIFGHVTPTAIVVIAIGELNGTRAIGALCVDVS